LIKYRHMKNILLTCALALLFAVAVGCKDDSAANKKDEASEKVNKDEPKFLTEFRAFSKHACACADADCVKDAVKTGKSFAERFSVIAKSGVVWPRAQLTEFTALSKKSHKCIITKLKARLKKPDGK